MLKMCFTKKHLLTFNNGYDGRKKRNFLGLLRSLLRGNFSSLYLTILMHLTIILAKKKEGGRRLSPSTQQGIMIGTPLPLLKGGGEAQDLPKIESLGGRGVPKFLLERGDNPEKGGLMQKQGTATFYYFTVQLRLLCMGEK